MKFKKSLLAFGTLATVAAPVAAVVSCGSDESVGEQGTKASVLTIQAEKAWVPTYQKIVDKFVADHADLMKANGVDKVLVQEAGAFDMADALSAKGTNDSSVADVLLLPGDRLTGMMENDYINPFNEATPQAFATEYLDGDTFLPGAINASMPGIDGTHNYAIPENVEAMIGIKKEGVAAPAHTMTVVSDLWKANGFFNDGTTNLRDIVRKAPAGGITLTDGTKVAEGKSYYNSDLVTAAPVDPQAVVQGNTNPDSGDAPETTTDAAKAAADKSANANATKAFLTAGFTNMFGASMETGKLFGTDALQSDAGKAAPNVFKKFTENIDKAQMIAGPWEKASIQEAVGEENKLTFDQAPNTYKQWAGGWNYVINGRVGDEEQNVAEALIAAFLNKDNAADLLKGADKLSPTTQGQTKVDLGTPETQDVKAIYETAANLQPRPTAAEFGVVWGAYADTIQAQSKAIVAGSATADELAGAFIAAIKAAVVTANA